jgi:hypothetical protein
VAFSRVVGLNSFVEKYDGSNTLLGIPIVEFGRFIDAIIFDELGCSVGDSLVIFGQLKRCTF